MSMNVKEYIPGSTSAVAANTIPAMRKPNEQMETIYNPCFPASMQQSRHNQQAPCKHPPGWMQGHVAMKRKRASYATKAMDASVM